MLNLKQLSHFAAAAEVGSFVKAGDALNISTNSIVHSVNSLEQQLDCRLFTRKASHGLTITADGEKLLHEAAALLKRARDVEEAFTEAATLKGEVVLGCLDSLAWSLAPLLIEHLGRLYPELTVHLHIISTTSMTHRDNKEKYDLLLTFSDGSAIDGFDQDDFMEVQPFIMMAHDHPLSDHSALTIDQIQPFPLIVLDTGPRDSYFLDLFEKLGRPPIIGLRTSSSIVSWSLVSVTEMIAIRHLRPLNPVSPVGKKVVCLPFAERVPVLKISILSNHRIGKNKMHRVSVFKETARQFFEDNGFDQYVMRSTQR